MGPRQSLYSADLLIGFNILLYNIEKRNIDPIVACEKIRLGTDLRFVCFDRLETETELSFIEHVKSYNSYELEEINSAKIKANEDVISTASEYIQLRK